MSDKAKKKSPAREKSCFGFTTESLVLQQLEAKAPRAAKSERHALIRVSLAKKDGPAQRILETETRVEISIYPSAVTEAETDPSLKTPLNVRVRDLVGASFGTLERLDVSYAEYDFDLEGDALEAAILGLEIALYRFKRIRKNESAKTRLMLSQNGKALAQDVLESATRKGIAVNLARHLVNLPPNLLNPVSYAEAIESLFRKAPAEVEVWDEKRLAKEKMGLHLAVGQASHTPPRLVHIRYRPKKAKAQPVAFVGKGITFDSGGLDIKPSSGMRLMKKDMGGSAAVVALAWWAVHEEVTAPVDFYVALAENAIGSNAFRPSDILQARNGTTVEIHNTDAEGRLVLADAMDVAATQKEKPRFIVDVATLTGAIKVALGSGLAGLFSNDAELAQSLFEAGQRSGDPSWIMPLFQKYRPQMNTIFADQLNSVDGFGGAITAALFLEKYAAGTSWAHLDIYAWKDSADGAFLEGGGNGQSVLNLAHWLKGLK